MYELLLILVSLFAGVIVGWYSRGVHPEEDQEVVTKIEDAINKVKGIDPDPNFPPKEKK